MDGIMKKFLSCAAATTLVAGCETVDTTKSSAVGVERHQRMMVSSDEVNKAAAQSYSEVLAQAQKQGALDKDAATVQRVKTIVGRLIPQTGALRPDAPAWKWEA